MPNATKAIPDNYTRVTPYLCVDNANDAMAYYCKIFGATERMRMDMGGTIGHAELQIGDSVIMLSDPFPDMGVKTPQEYGGSPVTLNIYVEDVDTTMAAAIEHGATEVMPATDQFWGDRSGKITDPWGHTWHIATHIEDVSAADMQQRAAEMFGQD